MVKWVIWISMPLSSAQLVNSRNIKQTYSSYPWMWRFSSQLLLPTNGASLVKTWWRNNSQTYRNYRYLAYAILM
ncbi:hypothetical protein GGS24DRAFT_438822, partial [Hypoxylon argillaceum]